MADCLKERTKQYILQMQMIRPGDRVTAGVSGGADSVCLLRILADLREELQFFLDAVHVEHGLRGESALADAAFTEALCSSLQVPCQVVHVDAAAEAARRHMSVEEAGRALRYEAFEDHIADCDAEGDSAADRNRGADPNSTGSGGKTSRCLIATAHHLEDQAETLLLNLSRGTGLRGMGGIRPVQGNRIRPLLFASREEIENYLREKGQDFRTDETNMEEHYTRNVIRARILPALKERVNARASAHLAAAAGEAGEADAFIRRLAREKMQACARQEDTAFGRTEILTSAELAKEDPYLQACILRMAIEQLRGGVGLKDISRDHIEAVLALAKKDGDKKIELPADLRAQQVYGEIWLYVLQADNKIRGTQSLKISAENAEPGEECRQAKFGDLAVSWQFMEASAVPVPVPQNRYTKWLAYDTMGGEICLRYRRRGDYLTVNSSGGTKKLKDYLIDQKVPAWQRDRLPVIAQGSHILWVYGGRISEAAKVQPDTDRVLKISIQTETACRRAAVDH